MAIQAEYGLLARRYVAGFREKWIADSSTSSEELLGSGDIQSLADLSNSFSVIREMKIVLIDKKLLVGLAIFLMLTILHEVQRVFGL